MLIFPLTCRDDVIKLLLPVFADSKSNMEVLGVTALAAGLISVGSCNLDVTSTILQTLIEKSETDLKVRTSNTWSMWLFRGHPYLPY